MARWVVAAKKADFRGITRYEDLPENCRHYVEYLEKLICCPITMVSNGPRREEMIYRKSSMPSVIC